MMDFFGADLWQFNWQDFHFVRPLWLVAIFPLLALVYLLKRVDAKKSGWQGIVASHLYQHMVISKDKTSASPPFYLLTICWLLASIAMAGPAWQKLPQPVYQVNTGKVLMLDMSLSMRSTDLSPDRLSRAKFKSIDLLNAIDDGEVGLVVYAGDAFTVSPLTSDVSNIIALIPSLRPEIMPVGGSYPLAAFEEAEKLLSRAGYTKGEIYWITDGVDLSDVDPIREKIAASDYHVSILGLGTENGAPITQADGSLLKDSSGNIVIPKLNSRYLKQIANAGNTRYTDLSIDDSDINSMKIATHVVDQEQVSDDVLGEGDQWQDMGAFLVILFLPFAAYAFRRGILLVVLFLGVFSHSQPSFAESTSALDSFHNQLFKTNNQRAKQAFEKGDYTDAAALFDDPMWRGGALYEAGEYQAALENYQQVDGLEAIYNQGNALAKLGDLARALEKYEAVLSQDSSHTNASINKAIVEKLLEQQEQQEQQEQNSEQEDDSQETEQNSENQQSDSQNEDSQSSDNQNADNQQDGEPSEPDASEQNEQQNDKSQEEQDNENEPQQEQQSSEDEATAEEQDKQSASAQQQEQAPTPEQLEQMQRDRVLLNKVPDDPAFLLQRKMLLESQQRKRERLPSTNQKEW